MVILDSDFLLVTETFNCADAGLAWGILATAGAIAGCGFDPDFNAAFVTILDDFFVGSVVFGDGAFFIEAGAFCVGDADFAFAVVPIFAGSFAGVAVFFIAFAMDQHTKITRCKQLTRST